MCWWYSVDWLDMHLTEATRSISTGNRSFRLQVVSTPCTWDASLSQGYPLPPSVHRYPFLHLGGERHCESKVSCPRTLRPGFKPRPARSGVDSTNHEATPPPVYLNSGDIGVMHQSLNVFWLCSRYQQVPVDGPVLEGAQKRASTLRSMITTPPLESSVSTGVVPRSFSTVWCTRCVTIALALFTRNKVTSAFMQLRWEPRLTIISLIRPLNSGPNKGAVSDLIINTAVRPDFLYPVVSPDN